MTTRQPSKKELARRDRLINQAVTRMTHGGQRPGAGRKPRHAQPMVQKTVRLPQEWIDRIVTEFGSVQNGIEELVWGHLVNGGVRW